MKYETRRKRFMIRVNPMEYEYLRREADERSQKISEYIRSIIFANAVLISSDGRK